MYQKKVYQCVCGKILTHKESRDHWQTCSSKPKDH